jgi:hypothetical protein
MPCVQNPTKKLIGYEITLKKSICQHVFIREIYLKVVDARLSGVS